MARKRSASIGEEARTLDFNRIEYLLNPGQFKDKKITIVGLGSGGAPVCEHLTMNGFRKWDLYDPDTLEMVNLVKHPRMRKDIGRPKVAIQEEWIIDRNPKSEVNSFVEDVITSENFINSIKASDIVLSCPDKKSVREFINDKCVEFGIPFVTASVFRTGIGGEIFSYIPKETGCYKCLQLYSLTNDINLTDDALGLTEEEEENIYGLGDTEFHASGLSMDIQMISLIQARMALSILTRHSTTKIPKIKGNWIIFGNRPSKGIFRSHFEAKQMFLKPQKICNCLEQPL